MQRQVISPQHFPRSVRDWLLTGEALCWVLFAWLLVRMVPFERWSFLLGVKGEITPHEPLPDHAQRHMWRIQRAMSYVISHLPGTGRRFSCLIRAAASQWMLRRRKISSTLYLGVKRNADSKPFRIKSHAWLRCGEHIIAGDGPHVQDYTEIAQFGSYVS